MKRLISIFFFCCLFILILFFLMGGLEEKMTLLLESSQNTYIYYLVSFLLLSTDIFMPVPSSFVMILNGKVLGVFLGGLLSTGSGLVCSMIGYFLGRKSEKYIDRFFSSNEKDLSQNLFQRYGKVAIVFSKALPIASEAVAFLSGTSGISLKKYFLLSFAGHLLISGIYAYIGNLSSTADSNLISMGVILLVLLLLWVFRRIMLSRPEEEK